MNPITTKSPITVTFENQQDVVNFVARPILVPNIHKFNAAMSAMRDPGTEVSYHPVIGSDVVYRVNQDVNIDATAVESVLRQVYACRRRNQMIVMGAITVGVIAAAVFIGHDDDEDKKKD